MLKRLFGDCCSVSGGYFYLFYFLMGSSFFLALLLGISTLLNIFSMPEEGCLPFSFSYILNTGDLCSLSLLTRAYLLLEVVPDGPL
jgi:hypothetical protein